jgi:hypothetical protein
MLRLRLRISMKLAVPARSQCYPARGSRHPRRPECGGLTSPALSSRNVKVGVVDVHLERNLLEVEDDVVVLDDTPIGENSCRTPSIFHCRDRRPFVEDSSATQRVAGRAEPRSNGARQNRPNDRSASRVQLQALRPLKTFHNIGHFLSPTGPQTGLQTCKYGHRPPAAGLFKAAGR